MKIVLRKIPNFFLVYVTFKGVVQILHHWGTETHKQSKKLKWLEAERKKSDIRLVLEMDVGDFVL